LPGLSGNDADDGFMQQQQINSATNSLANDGLVPVTPGSLSSVLNSF